MLRVGRMEVDTVLVVAWMGISQDEIPMYACCTKIENGDLFLVYVTCVSYAIHALGDTIYNPKLTMFCHEKSNNVVCSFPGSQLYSFTAMQLTSARWLSTLCCLAATDSHCHFQFQLNKLLIFLMFRYFHNPGCIRLCTYHTTQAHRFVS